MTPELKAYLDYKASDEPGNYEEQKRLKALVPREVRNAYWAAEKLKHFKPENGKTESQQEFLSPSGKYKLTVTPFSTSPGCWSYTQGRVYAKDSDVPIALVNRNYSAFPFLFVEGHPNGQDYLIAGEEYQGQTVVELKTGRKLSILPEDAEDGFGFCWSDYTFDEKSQMLTVGGCIWACPYEFRFYDFSNPMDGWPEIENEEGSLMDARSPTLEPDGTIKCYQTESSDVDEDDDDDEKPEKERPLAATQTFRREGLKLVLVEEWVSDKETKRRTDQTEARQRYEEKLKNFKENDPLYLYMTEQVGEPPFKPQDYVSTGITHDRWHPETKYEDSRMCRRIQAVGAIKLDLEFGFQTAPIKLIVYRKGKDMEDLWFPRTIDGMKEAFKVAKELLR